MIDKILFSGNFTPKDISVNILPQSSRKIDLNCEKIMEEKWSEILKTENAWDSDVYRLESVEKVNNKLKINLSTVKFSIRASSRYVLEELIKLGEDYYIKGCSVVGIIKTTDNKYILGKTSEKTLRKNQITFIGGNTSKQEIEIKNAEDIFENIYKELSEEINLSKKYIEKCELKSIILSSTMQCPFIFDITLNISSDEVQKLFETENDGEIKEVLHLSKEEFLSQMDEMGRWKVLVKDMI